MPSPAYVALVLTFAAMALLLFASVSPPAWDSVYFLKATAAGKQTVFGVLGKCVKGGSCSAKNVGYDLTLEGTDIDIGPKVLRNLTYTLILHPIAGFLALVALVLGLLGVCAASRILTVLMALVSGFAGLVALVAFVIDIVLWVLVRNKIRDASYDAELGNANWLTVGAVVALGLAFCFSFCGACGRFANGRMAGEKY